MQRYRSLNSYLAEEFGMKLYKLALDGGFTCPNRDGTVGTRGCIFCSGRGSGDFAETVGTDIYNAIERAKLRVAHKNKSGKYIAYFQSFTNTYAPIEILEALYTEAISHPDIEVLSIATRPDCLDDEIISLLSRLNKIKPVWVELGLQREQEIIIMHFGLTDGKEYTQKEVADLLGISQSYISRLEKRIIDRLRKEMLRQMQI